MSALAVRLATHMAAAEHTQVTDFQGFTVYGFSLCLAS